LGYENQNGWNEHMSIVLFSYKIAFKLGIGHIPFQLVYGLHLLLPMEYLLPSKPRQNPDPTLVKVLISQLS
jgi:hypothetical protein